AKPQCRQVVLVDACPPAHVDRGQKLLQRNVLFALEQLFAALGFLQPQICLESTPDRIIQRQPQWFIADRLRRHAPIERIVCRARICSLSKSGRRPCQANQPDSQASGKGRQPGKLSSFFHIHHSLRCLSSLKDSQSQRENTEIRCKI